MSALCDHIVWCDTESQTTMTMINIFPAKIMYNVIFSKFFTIQKSWKPILKIFWQVLQIVPKGIEEILSTKISTAKA